MNTAAIYARYSSDMQSERSIEDQFALCRQFANREGLSVVRTFHDSARSGGSVIGRTGLEELMAAARARVFSVLIVEGLDRLSRDLEDLAGIFKRLSYIGVEIQTVHEGKADPIKVGMRGLMGTLFLQDVTHKVRRGMAGVVRDGRNPGGRAYGYSPVPGKPGELAVVEHEAEIVRRIFADYAAGLSPRAIANALNDEGIPAPRGRYWSASALNGNKARGHGILVNSIYAGEIAWNRTRFVKDPDTGKRVPRVNPKQEWQTARVPHLAIVDRQLFDEVRQRALEKGHKKPWKARKNKHLLSGLLRCGCCGAGMSIKDRRGGRIRIQCTAAKEAGVCGNGSSYQLDEIYPKVLGGLKERLSNRDAVKVWLKAYNDERQKLTKERTAGRPGIEARLEKAKLELDQTVKLVIKGVISETEATTTLRPLRDEIAALEAQLATIGEPSKLVRFEPAAANTYLAAVASLESTLAESTPDGAPSEAAEAVRSLLGTVTIVPQSVGGFTVVVRGMLNRILGNIASANSPPVGGIVGSGGGI